MVTVTGGPGNDILNGSVLDDLIKGLGGNDFIDGRGGRDRMEGGIGNDIFVVDSSDDIIIELAGQGSDTVYTEADYRLGLAASVETLSARDWAALTDLQLTGNDLANAIIGNAGDNLIDGKAGADTMVGLGGDDIYVVDNFFDRVIESGGGGNDTVFTDVSYALAPTREIEVLSARDWRSTTALELSGNPLQNTLFGNDGNNVLAGGGGGDVLVGYAGNDRYIIADAADRVIEAAGGGSDAVFIEADYRLSEGASVEIFSTRDWSSTAAIDLVGNGLDNEVDGNNGANVIDGGYGLDILVGFEGDDTFSFSTALGADNVDRIVDFVSGSDRIALDDRIFTELDTGQVGEGIFAIGESADGENVRLIYNPADGLLRYDADGSGSEASVVFAQLTPQAALSATDFIVG